MAHVNPEAIHNVDPEAIDNGIALLHNENLALIQNYLTQPLPENAYQVLRRKPDVIIRLCKDFIANLQQHLDNNATLETHVPSRTAGNQVFSPFLRRYILVDNGHHIRINPAKIPMFLHVLRFILLGQKITVEVIFSASPETFNDVYDRCNDCILDICVIFKCTRESLGIIPEQTGVVMGDLWYEYGNRPIHCLPNMDGQNIPAQLHSLDDNTIQSNARFVLVVESYEAYNRLVQCRYHERRRCIIITPRGFPGSTALKFIHILWLQLRIPVVLWLNGDPYGFMQYSKYVHGCSDWSFDGQNLVTPMRYMGVWPYDISRYNLNPNIGLKLTHREHVLAANWIGEAELNMIHDLELQVVLDEMVYMTQAAVTINLCNLNMFGLGFMGHVLDLKFSSVSLRLNSVLSVSNCVSSPEVDKNVKEMEDWESVAQKSKVIKGMGLGFLFRKRSAAPIIRSSSPQKTILLKSVDGETFEVEESMALESQTIKDMLEEDPDDSTILFPRITSKIMEKVIEYLKRHAAKSSSSSFEAANQEASEEDLKKFDAEFVKVDFATVCQLIRAATDLKIKSLHNLAAQTLLDMIKGKTPAEARKMFVKPGCPNFVGGSSDV